MPRRTGQRLTGHILTPEGFIDGTIEFDARITRVHGVPISEAIVNSGDAPRILPGFIDTHVHGGGGHDMMEGGEAASRIATLHARHGTTAMLATTMTAPADDLRAAFLALAKIRNAPKSHAPIGARLLGVHLEGPYINRNMLGAQPDFARPLNLDEINALNQIVAIKLITLAPEVPGSMELIAPLCQAGFKVQIGHTAGTYDDGVAAMARGASGFTHLFNAMTGFHHRKPGMAGAALAHAEYAEIIPDLLHVHEGAIHLALRAIPRLFCVTDSTAAAGMPDGEYRLGRQTVTKCLGGVRLSDGTLAGSTLTMDQALRNLVQTLGLSLSEASMRVSTHAADFLGIADRGRLAPQAWADIVVLDAKLNLTAVFTEGVALEH